MNYPTHPGAPPSMQPWQQQQQQSLQPAAQPSAYPPPVSYPPAGIMPYPKAPSRNVALIVVSAILLVVSLAPAILFVMNLHQYLTIEDRWANDPVMAGNDWITELVKQAALKRMMIFGPVAAVFGLGGLVTALFGLRKK